MHTEPPSIRPLSDWYDTLFPQQSNTGQFHHIYYNSGDDRKLRWRRGKLLHSHQTRTPRLSNVKRQILFLIIITTIELKYKLWLLIQTYYFNIDTLIHSLIYKWSERDIVLLIYVTLLAITGNHNLNVPSLVRLYLSRQFERDSESDSERVMST